jgi:hypothetical protein
MPLIEFQNIFILYSSLNLQHAPYFHPDSSQRIGYINIVRNHVYASVALINKNYGANEYYDIVNKTI